MRLGISVVFALMVSLPAAAQDKTSAFIGGSVSAANMESRTEVAFSGSFGYRFSRIVSFVMEATGVPSVESGFPTNTPVILAGRRPSRRRASQFFRARPTRIWAAGSCC
jgi:hypothetical protein